jgi:hypothetical protein
MQVKSPRKVIGEDGQPPVQGKLDIHFDDARG